MAEEKDSLIEEFIKPGIKNAIEQVARDATEEFIDQLRIKIRQELGRIVINLTRQFDVIKDQNRIVITFEEKDARKGK